MDNPYFVLETPTYTLVQIDVQNRLKNYIYLLKCNKSGQVAAVDPTNADAAQKTLQALGWTLDMILCTHHHADHTDGNASLTSHYNCPVYGNADDAARIQSITHKIAEGDIISVGILKAHIFNIYGHTIGHIAFHIEQEQLLFCGDTVFSAGCGRMFEGDGQMMQHSMQQIMQRCDDATLLCCAHEYTQDNIRFALTIEPDNMLLHLRLREVDSLRKNGLPTVPTTLGMEKTINPFLRAHLPHIKEALGDSTLNDGDSFARLRHKKDNFS